MTVRHVGLSLQEDELRALLEKKPHPVCYDGFEPSGRMHIAQGILKAINVSDGSLVPKVVVVAVTVCWTLLRTCVTLCAPPCVQVNKLTSCGCVFKFWVADWFALLNNKVCVCVCVCVCFKHAMWCACACACACVCARVVAPLVLACRTVHVDPLHAVLFLSTSRWTAI